MSRVVCPCLSQSADTHVAITKPVSRGNLCNPGELSALIVHNSQMFGYLHKILHQAFPSIVIKRISSITTSTGVVTPPPYIPISVGEGAKLAVQR